MHSKIIRLIPVLLLLITAKLVSQPLAFTYGTTGITERGICIAEDNEGNFFIAGNRFSFVDPTGGQPTNVDLEILKVDASGNEIWSLLIDSTLMDGAFDAIAESNGDLTILAQNCSQVQTGIGCSKQNTRLYRFDTNGNMLWYKAYYEGFIGISSSFVKTQDNGYAIAGLTNKYSDYGDLFLLKVNETGEEEWEALFPVTSGRSFGVANAAGGGFFIAGSSIESNGRTALIAKVDEQGNSLWTKYYGSASLFGEIFQPSGNGVGLLQTQATTDFLDKELSLMNEDGEVIWEKDLFMDISRPTGVMATSDGIVITGTDELHDINDKLSKTVKYDYNGSLMWAKNQDPFPNNYEHPNDIIESNGGFAIFGFTELIDTVAFVYPDKFMLILLDENGDLDSAEVVGTSEQMLDSTPLISVYPNPANDQVTFSVQNINNQPFELIISNALGQTIRQYSFNNSSYLVDVSDLNAGIYYYQIFKPQTKSAYNGKLIVR